MLTFRTAASDLLYISKTPLFCHFLFACLMNMLRRYSCSPGAEDGDGCIGVGGQGWQSQTELWLAYCQKHSSRVSSCSHSLVAWPNECI